MIDRFNPLKSEDLIILADPQRMITAGARAVDGWAKENDRDVQMIPDYVSTKISVRFVTTIEEVLANALLPCST